MKTCSRSRPGPDGKINTQIWDCMRCEIGAPANGDGLRIGIGVALAIIAVGSGSRASA